MTTKDSTRLVCPDGCSVQSAVILRPSGPLNISSARMVHPESFSKWKLVKTDFTRQPVARLENGEVPRALVESEEVRKVSSPRDSVKRGHRFSRRTQQLRWRSVYQGFKVSPNTLFVAVPACVGDNHCCLRCEHDQHFLVLVRELFRIFLVSDINEPHILARIKDRSSQKGRCGSNLKGQPEIGEACSLPNNRGVRRDCVIDKTSNLSTPLECPRV